MRRYAWDYADDARGPRGRYGAGDPRDGGLGGGGFRSEAVRGGDFRGGGYRGGEIPAADAFDGGRYRGEDLNGGRLRGEELRGRRMRGEELRPGDPFRDVGRGRSAAWLAEPVGGRVGYDRLYGSQRGARYGERYDLGYAPLSEMNPIARALRREYRDLARGSRRRSCRAGNDGW